MRAKGGAVHPKMEMATGQSCFGRLADSTARAGGKPATFALAVSVVVIWAISGPLFHYSDTWQLVINTGTTIITFLMVFLIQSTQNRDTQALQIKLDELIRATRGARNTLLDLERLDETELERIRSSNTQLAERAKSGSAEADTGIPEINRRAK